MAPVLRQPPRIEGWGAGGFTIGGVRHEGSVLLLDDAVRPWPPRSLAALTPDDFAPVLGAGREQVEFVVLGAGARTAPAPRAVREALAAAGLGLELASTAEACRLYNALAPEGRRVVAALLAV